MSSHRAVSSRSNSGSVRRVPSEKVLTKVFANGDSYSGGWKEGMPHGHGRYTWADGSVYEGAWNMGYKEGIGTYRWPNGALFRGEWLAGCMHGVGTFESPDSTQYQGGWANDLKHGLGRKVYSNGDVYEGLWKLGKSDGPGRYRWKNGNEYDGEWRAGRMHGQGTLKWNTGDRYDGEFQDGEEDGLGVFTWADGSTYDGFWCSGRKHGLGVYRPAAAEPTSRRLDHRHTGDAPVSPRLYRSGSREDGPTRVPSEAPIPTPSLAEAGGEAVDTDGEQDETGTLGATTTLSEAKPSSVFVREYEDGRLLREDILRPGELELVFGPSDRRRTERHNRRRRRAANKQGETIFKGHRSYDLMLNLQLGIRYSVGRINPSPVELALKEVDFRYKAALPFPRDGSRATPPHPSNDFTWKDYCPAVFRSLRRIFGIDTADYMTSICGDQALRELPSPGKSGSIFFLSHDDRYIIKTMRKGEMKLLLDLLPRYHEHVDEHPHTLLVKFFGLHRVKPNNGSKVRFIVMNNVFRTDLPIHRKYDLKGSTLGRTSLLDKASVAPSTILKDLDLDIVFKLEEGWPDRLMRQLALDCALLEELRVMDYSLLLGVHYRTSNHFSSPPATDKEDDTDDGNETPYPGGARHGIRRSGGSAELPDSPAALASPKASTLTDGEAETQHRARILKAQETELAAIRGRLVAKFGNDMSEKRLDDLLKLAQFKMLSREIRIWRSPTTVLSMRPKRSMTMRPVAFAAGATDELAHRLGQTRVHLGLNMAATALPMGADKGTAPDDVILYFGIIDILQEYNMSKRIEHGFKSIINDGKAISAVDPKQYSRRFQDFMKKVFV